MNGWPPTTVAMRTIAEEFEGRDGEIWFLLSCGHTRDSLTRTGRRMLRPPKFEAPHTVFCGACYDAAVAADAERPTGMDS